MTVPYYLIGHADDRGTSPYNLHLGDDRAKVVRAFLVGAGISANRIATRTVGKEAPLLPGNTTSARAQNRSVIISYSNQTLPLAIVHQTNDLQPE